MKPIQYCIISVHSQEDVQQAAEHVVGQMSPRGIKVTAESNQERRLYLTLEANTQGASISGEVFRTRLGEHRPDIRLILLQFDES